MDLDNLKATWQKDTDGYTELNSKDMEQLQLILKEKTSGTLVKVKKKYERIISFILIGTFLNIAISPFLHWILGDSGPMLRMPALLPLLTFVTVCLILMFFYWMKYISLKEITPADDLKRTLTEQIQQLKKSYKQEIYFLTMLFLLLFTIGRMVSQYQGNGNFADIFRLDIMLAMLAGVGLLLFGIWQRKKHYTRNIAELKQYLAELDE